MHTKCRDRDSQLNFKYLKTTRVIWCHFLSTWVTPVCGLGFLPSRPWDEELGAIIYLRGNPGGTVKGWAVIEKGGKPVQGEQIMVLPWWAIGTQASERLCETCLCVEAGISIHQLPSLTGGGVLQDQRTCSGRRMQEATGWMVTDCH